MFGVFIGFILFLYRGLRFKKDFFVCIYYCFVYRFEYDMLVSDVLESIIW